MGGMYYAAFTIRDGRLISVGLVLRPLSRLSILYFDPHALSADQKNMQTQGLLFISKQLGSFF